MLVVVATVLPAASAEKQNSEFLFQKALHAETADADYEQALSIYTELVKSEADDKPFAARALYRLGLCCEKLGRKNKALGIFLRLGDEYGPQIVDIYGAVEKVAEAKAGKREDKSKHVELTLNLSDGSRIVGEPIRESLPISAIYGDLDISFRQVRTIRWQHDTGIVSIELKDGDSISGKLLLDALEITAQYANVSVPIRHIESIDISLVGSQGSTFGRSLVLYYSFDRAENAGRDASPNKYSGVISGPAWDAEGKKGGALLFDGQNDCLKTPPEHRITGDEMTLSMWVYEEARKRNNANPAYANMLYYAAEKGIGLNEAASSDGRIQYCLNGSLRSWQDSGVEIPLRKWTHVTFVVKSGDSYRIYINGVEKFRIENTAERIAIAPLTFGAWTGYTNCGYFRGKLDEIRLYKTALSENEITALYDLNK